MSGCCAANLDPSRGTEKDEFVKKLLHDLILKLLV